MASLWGNPGAGHRSRASKLSQLVKSASERQEQRPAVPSASRSDRGGSRSREVDAAAPGGQEQPAGGRRLGEEEATFYSEEEDSEDDEDEL